ncbi:MAG TPA: class I SAM-dependent methyltransferase [Polyangiaceae bacterium]|nr:class I SAM-dependent methyltransferase [Polyangiaceae bacterium]
MHRQTDGATWHYGLIAKWWAEFLQGGSEIDYLRAWIDRHGGPVLDAGCGTGRLLLPYLRAGLDIDGADVSADMLAYCAAAAAREGFQPALHRQALHELDLPRHYRTIIVNGVLGLGADRPQDREGLRRLLHHLEPGGALLINHYIRWNDASWQYWLPEHRAKLPEPIPGPWDPTPTSDGSAQRMLARVLSFDPLGPTFTREMIAESFRDGVLEKRESHLMTENVYFPNELVLLLERAGFRNVQLKNDHPKTTFAPEGCVFTLIAER